MSSFAKTSDAKTSHTMTQKGAPANIFNIQVDESFFDLKTIKDLAKILMDLRPGEIKKMLGIKDKGAIRNFFELVPAGNQCQKAGIIFNALTTRCWLCGCIIGGEEKACEHIIPALRAIMFKGIITNKLIQERINAVASNIEAYTQIVAKNYLWAHANCNGSSGKGSLVLIKFDEQSATFIPDKDKIRHLINRIKTVRYDFDGGVVCYDTEGAYLRDVLYKNQADKDGSILAYTAEIQAQCESINDDYNYFKAKQNDREPLLAYASYIFTRVKLFFSDKSLESFMTDEDRAARDERYDNEQNEKNIAIKKELLKNIKLNQEANFHLDKYFRYYQEIYSRKVTQGVTVKAEEDILEDLKNYYEISVSLFLLRYSLFDSGVIKGKICEKILKIIHDNAAFFIDIPLHIGLTLIEMFVKIELFQSGNTDNTIDTNDYLSSWLLKLNTIDPIILRLKVASAIQRLPRNKGNKISELQNFLYVKNSEGDEIELDYQEFFSDIKNNVILFMLQLTQFNLGNQKKGSSTEDDDDSRMEEEPDDKDELKKPSELEDQEEEKKYYEEDEKVSSSSENLKKRHHDDDDEDDDDNEDDDEPTKNKSNKKKVSDTEIADLEKQSLMVPNKNLMRSYNLFRENTIDVLVKIFKDNFGYLSKKGFYLSPDGIDSLVTRELLNISKSFIPEDETNREISEMFQGKNEDMKLLNELFEMDYNHFKLVHGNDNLFYIFNDDYYEEHLAGFSDLFLKEYKKEYHSDDYNKLKKNSELRFQAYYNSNIERNPNENEKVELAKEIIGTYEHPYFKTLMSAKGTKGKQSYDTSDYADKLYLQYFILNSQQKGGSIKNKSKITKKKKSKTTKKKKRKTTKKDIK